MLGPGTGTCVVDELESRIFAELDRLILVDPHSHINPHAPASRSLGDLLGYHYYTELAHSAGLPKVEIEGDGLSDRTKVERLVHAMSGLDNTVQVSWLVELCQEFFGLEEGRITPANWEALYDRASNQMADVTWPEQVLKKSGLSKVFLTNDFDDPLEGFDTQTYLPCLRTDDLVFKLHEPAVRDRLRRSTQCDVGDLVSIADGIHQRFQHFVQHGAKACAISLPPDFSPTSVTYQAAANALDVVLAEHEAGQQEARQTLSRAIFWILAEKCAEFRLPFDLMIGVNRRVYERGVYQGQDLFDQRVSLIQYRSLFNQFAEVTFPVSVLSHPANHELVSYSWIFPNVVTHGHWWYSNIPACIEVDTRMRLEAVPRTKQIGYYSDMYKLEFGLPKFRMYKRVLARVLAKDFVMQRKWTEESAVELGTQVLRGNVARVFGV